MTKLSVNINKIALLRNSRGANLPNLVKVALDCEKFGAQGITVHPRPDERHVKYSDVPQLKLAIATEFNIEGNPNEKFVKLVCDNTPKQVTLVPDAPGVLTSNQGWDTIANKDFLKDVIYDFKKRGIRVSIFLDPSIEMMLGAKEVGTDRIEFYTGDYANNYSLNKEGAVKPFVEAAKLASKLQIGINAGHDLNLENLNFFYKKVPNLLEVSIGHAIVCDSVYYGLKNTIHMYKNLLTK
jgi:pyridoxine 5-phosphate synthase